MACLSLSLFPGPALRVEQERHHEDELYNGVHDYLHDRGEELVYEGNKDGLVRLFSVSYIAFFLPLLPFAAPPQASGSLTVYILSYLWWKSIGHGAGGAGRPEHPVADKETGTVFQAVPVSFRCF
jgi:hypothetical protein